MFFFFLGGGGGNPKLDLVTISAVQNVTKLPIYWQNKVV